MIAPDLAVLAARFAGELRAAGLAVGPERAARFAAAIELADPQSVPDLYWCGLATLIADPAEVPIFDHVFGLIFGSRRPEEPASEPSPGTGAPTPGSDGARMREGTVPRSMTPV